MHRQDVKQRQGIYSTLHWAGLGLLLSPPSGLAATNDASLDNSQFCFQKLVPVCNSSYLLISHGRPKPCSSRLVELLCAWLPAASNDDAHRDEVRAMVFGCFGSNASGGRKSTGRFRRMLNAAELVSQCKHFQGPRLLICAAQKAFKGASAISHKLPESPFSPPSQSNTPMTLLNNKTSKAALRSNLTKISPVLQQPRATFRGEHALRAQGKGLQSTCSKKETSVFSRERFPRHINKPQGHAQAAPQAPTRGHGATAKTCSDSGLPSLGQPRA